MCFSKLFRKEENDMQYTEKLELNLPEDDDYIESTSREAINDNFEKLDDISPAKYIIASYNLTGSQASYFVGGKIDFYNDGTYRAKGTVYAFAPDELAVGTVVSTTDTIYPTIQIGSFLLPNNCPYSLSTTDYVNLSLFKTSFDGLTLVMSGTTHDNLGAVVFLPYVTIEAKKIRPLHNLSFALCNLTGASRTITESDTTKHPRSTYVVEGTYTED